MKDWSIVSIQNIIEDRDAWDKKTLYATDSNKCPSGVYYQMIGEKPTNPDDPRGLRRMDVGNMIELNQIKKLRSLGILIDAQRRIFDERYNVSGRPDAIVISPESCTPEAKEMIERKKSIYKTLISFEHVCKKMKQDYLNGELSKDKYLQEKANFEKDILELEEEDLELDKKLLIPNPENSLIIIEIKSINERGFEWRLKEGQPMDEHKKQLMFYLWKMRETYPWILGRVLYVDTSYQNLLEFNVDLEPNVIEDMKKFWDYIMKTIHEKNPPMTIPSIVQNPKSGKWSINFQADWCKYHILCTKDPMWKAKALEEVELLNSQIKKNGTRKRNSSN